MRYLIFSLILMMGCGGDRVVERVERIERVELVERSFEVEDLYRGVGSLVFEDGGGLRSYCGGVWVGEEDLLTAYHCIRDVGSGREGSVIRVRSYGGSLGVGKVERLDMGHDLGLIRVVGMEHGVVRLGSRCRVGDRLHVVGHARGLEWSYLQGWVSSYREMEVEFGRGEFLQVTAPIYYGDSGGGVFNDRGELVGVTSFIYKVPNVAFAIGVGEVVKFLGK